ncbi:MAG: hypothetical protein FWE16_05770, partial [Firmicutes bacterium]|nr:hypothetical protein [Bacillota bacterium]
MTTPKRGYAGFIMTCMGVLCVVTIAVASVFVVATNNQPVAGDPTPGLTGTGPSVQNSLFNLDGTINGQIAANILRDLNEDNTAVDYRGAYFRLFPDHGTGHTLSLSQSFWRVAHVDGDRIAMWSWNAYRTARFNPMAPNNINLPIHTNYLSSELRTNILNDFNGLPNAITENSAIITADFIARPSIDGFGGPRITDRIWLPSRFQVAYEWNPSVFEVGSPSSQFRPFQTTSLNSGWLSSAFNQGTTVQTVDLTGGASLTGTSNIWEVRNNVIPALFLDRQILETHAATYVANSVSLFNYDGGLNKDQVELLYNKVETGDRVTPFRLFPNIGTGTAFHLSRTYFRIAHVDSSNQRLALIAETSYRASQFNLIGQGNNYATSLVRTNLLNDFNNVNIDGRFNLYILPANKTSDNLVSTDRVWLPSYDEVRDGGLWDLNARLRGLTPRVSFFSASTSLRSPYGIDSKVRMNANGSFVNHGASTNAGVAPSLYLDTLALFSDILATFQDGSNPLARVSSPEEGGASATRIGIELANPGPTELTF